jgi:hypothetical protein
MVDRPTVAEPLVHAEAREAARFAMRLVEEGSTMPRLVRWFLLLGCMEFGTECLSQVNKGLPLRSEG